MATHSFSLNLAGTHFDLASIPVLNSGRVVVQGGLDFAARASGTVEHPVIDATIRLRDLTLDQELAGDFTIRATSQGDELRLSGVSQFKTADLSLQGSIHPSGDWPASLDLRFKHLGCGLNFGVLPARPYNRPLGGRRRSSFARSASTARSA